MQLTPDKKKTLSIIYDLYIKHVYDIKTDQFSFTGENINFVGWWSIYIYL